MYKRAYRLMMSSIVNKRDIGKEEEGICKYNV